MPLSPEYLNINILSVYIVIFLWKRREVLKRPMTALPLRSYLVYAHRTSVLDTIVYRDLWSCKEYLYGYRENKAES